jgi:HEAT repeat protein
MHSLLRFMWCLMAIIAVRPATLAADSDLSPELRELRKVLHAPLAADVPESLALENRRQAISDITLRLCRLVDLRDALLLDTWRDGDADATVSAIDRSLRAAIRARFEAMTRASLRANDDAVRLAAVSIIIETDDRLRSQPFNSWNLSALAPDLAELATTSTSRAVCFQALTALGHLECDTRTVAQVCIAILQSPDPELRRRAAQAMCQIGTTIHKVADSQGASHGWTVPAIASGILEVLRFASVGLRDRDSLVRQECALCLDQFAQAAGQLVLDPRIRATALPSPDVNNLFCALREETTGLSAALNDSDPAVRLGCREALLDMAVAAERWQQVTACAGLDAHGTSGPGSPGYPNSQGASGLQSSAPALARGLLDADVKARRAAAEALEGLGEGAQSAESGLVQALSDQDLFVRWAALRALCRLPHLDAARAIPAISRLVRDSDLDVRIAAAKGLGALKCSQPEAIEALTRAVNDREPALQVAAIQALAAIGPQARSAIPAIAEGMATPDPRVRSAAATGLASFGPESAPYVEVIGSGTADVDPKVRRAAGDAMLAIAAPPSPTNASLVTALSLTTQDRPTTPAAPSRDKTHLMTTLDLVNHDRPGTSALMPQAPPAPLSASAAQASLPIGPVAAATGERPPPESSNGPDLGGPISQSELPPAQDSSEPVRNTGRTVTLPVISTGPPVRPINPPPDTIPPLGPGNSVNLPASSLAGTAGMPDVQPAMTSTQDSSLTGGTVRLPVISTSPPARQINAAPDTIPPVGPANSLNLPASSIAGAAMASPDVQPATISKQGISTLAAATQALNVAGWKPAVQVSFGEQPQAESVKRDVPFTPPKPIETAFSAGGDYTQYNQPPAHLPPGVIAISPGAIVMRAPVSDSAASLGSATTWQSYKPATTDSAIAVSRPLPPAQPWISPPAYAFDPSRVIAASSR